MSSLHQRECSECGAVHGARVCPVRQKREDREHLRAVVWGLAACFALSAIGLWLLTLAERRTP